MNPYKTKNMLAFLLLLNPGFACAEPVTLALVFLAGVVTGGIITYEVEDIMVVKPQMLEITNLKFELEKLKRELALLRAQNNTLKNDAETFLLEQKIEKIQNIQKQVAHNPQANDFSKKLDNEIRACLKHKQSLEACKQQLLKQVSESEKAWQ